MSAADRITDLLLRPVRAGRLALRNRVVVPAHTTNYAEHGLPSARHVAYHRERARGGVGLIITEGIRVHPTSLGRDNTISGFDDDVVAPLAAVADAVHAEGAAFAAQLLHTGRQSGGHLTLTPPWGASAVRWASSGRTPHVLSVAEIAEVVESFGASARRMVRAGVDAVEVHLGHGHLLQQFLSPATNRRDDAYGGSAANRMRLSHEVLRAVRQSVGPDFPIIVRISGDEFLDGGLDLPQMLEIVAGIRTEHDIDLLHVSHSAYAGEYTLATQMADMTFDPAPFRHLPAAFRAQFPDLPVLAVCRIDDLAVAADLVEAGAADLVAMARAHLADPALVRKHLEGARDTTRSCLACNEGCAGRLELGMPITCVVNPEAGFEREWTSLRTASRSAGRKRVLVVGGGPGGLSAARAAAEAGREVTLAERGAELGGAVRVATRMHRRQRLALLVDQLEQAVVAAGVTVLREHEVTAEEIVDGGWDAVVLAAGATDTGPRELAGRPVHHPADVLLGTASLGRRLVVVDEDGSWRGAGLASHLAAAGHEVDLVSPHGTAAWRIPLYSRPALVAALGQARVTVHAARRVTDWRGDDLVLADVVGGGEQVIPGVEDVVWAGPRAAADGLRWRLEHSPIAGRIHTAGDACAPRGLLEATFEGRFAGLTAAAGGVTDAAAGSLVGQI
ncbi:FAD-dependent oxidoreductase [Dactylosporangium salmoneum]|uniref:FAD-dependent oxidoreductase n=1 Tax=Dactylosporangium salmoneum TaxID=53361 RepID=A0ABN3GDH0_9ACTN